MIHGVIKIKGGPAEIARGMGDTMRQALTQLVLEWHKGMLPRHFDEDAYSRYGYQPRTKKYEDRKMRKFGHRRPLLYAANVGALMRQVTGRIDVAGTSHYATGTLRAPRFATLKPYPNSPDMAKELVAWSSEEEKIIGERLDAILTAWANGELQSVPTFHGGVLTGSELREQVETF